jgi:TonB family protein
VTPSAQPARPAKHRRAGILVLPVALVAALLVAALITTSCGRAPVVGDAPRALPVDVYADTGRTVVLHAEPPPSPASPEPLPRGSAWLARVSPSRGVIAEMPEVVAGSETLTVAPSEPPALVVEDGLKPPLPRASVPLAVPPGARGSVELDVQVDEQGTVSAVRWANGTRNPAMVRAAIECARAMRYFPAQRAGRPVAVWCRERFDFGGVEP